MITIIFGKPGAGKTAYLVSQMLRYPSNTQYYDLTKKHPGLLSWVLRSLTARFSKELHFSTFATPLG